MQEPLTTQAVGAVPSVPLAPLSYCLYARKSSEAEERQALSIDSQIKEMLELAAREGLHITEIRQESHSAKDSGQRPVFNQLLIDIRSGKFNALLTWNPDRLSRNAGDLGSLVDLMDQKLLHEIRTYGQRFTNSPSEKFLLMILCSQAKLENDNKGVNVKRGLRAKLEMGLWPSCPPTGYLINTNREMKGYMIIDTERVQVIREMFEKIAYAGYSGRRLYGWLIEVNFKARSGKPLSLSNVHTILRNKFYYGQMEYPKTSGNIYPGKHEPIISKELFDEVQDKLNGNTHIRQMGKEFAFTKLMKCGLCNSGISAQEKFKKLKDGSRARYIYYGCGRYYDKYCKALYLREEELIEQFINIIDTVDLNEIGIKYKIEQEINRYDAFRTSVLGYEGDESVKQTEISIRNYAKYILQKGSLLEKRELMASLKSTLLMKDKKILLKT